MAMTTCPQCNGEMSNYAPSCPHCGKMNPAAPQAILRQQKQESLSSISRKVPNPLPSVKSVAPLAPKERKQVHKGSGTFQWITELREEWKGLTPSKKTGVQTLFGFAIVVGMGLIVYALVS